MKILELCTSSGWGGLELYALNISKWLLETGYECLVVMLKGSLISSRLEETKLKSFTIQPRFRLWPIIAAWRLSRIIDRQDVDILHVHWGKDLILAVLAKRLSRRKPKLVFIRHMTITRYKGDIYHHYIYQNIDAYLVITKRLQVEAERFLPIDKGKIHLLYHGVPEMERADQSYCQSFLTRQGIQPEKFRVLLSGRIEHGKGQHVLLESVHLLQKRGLEVEACLLGHIMDKSYYKKLQKQCETYGLQDRFHYLGFIDRPTYIYNCFDVMVLTTYAETFGLVLIEAMKCGLPVIGSNAGGVPEIIEHGKTGLLYEPGDARGLADCLEQLANNETLRKGLARAGHQFANEVFSQHRHNSQLVRIFHDLTGIPEHQH